MQDRNPLIVNVFKGQEKNIYKKGLEKHESFLDDGDARGFPCRQRRVLRIRSYKRSAEGNHRVP